MQTHDTRVLSVMPLETPDELKRELPLDEPTSQSVVRARKQIEAVVHGRDPRLLVVVGPCSIHDPGAAIEYAERLAAVRSKYDDALLLCMRAYFEKPRTSVGWKGLINDPHLDGSCDMQHGLRVGRKLLCDLAARDLPLATEALDPVTPQYLADLIAWSAIGARTTESQTHREMASGLSMPVGFKNGTDGGLDVAINAMKAAAASHSFLGMDTAGRVSVVRTAGNPHAHLVLRGGSRGPNYGRAAVSAAAAQLAKAKLNARMMVDCSHDNSAKNHENQPAVADAVAAQLEAGSHAVMSVMIESNLVAGKQDLVPGRALTYGQSITDGCIDFATTERVLARLAEATRLRMREPVSALAI
ncbi:MAG: 3-deoxy-7-phosphoheptulonate synthase [Polyangiales bacterium]